jgi:hypothetical protein
MTFACFPIRYITLCDDWHGNAGCLFAQDLAMLTKVRTLIRKGLQKEAPFLAR